MEALSCDFCESPIGVDAGTCPQCGAEIYWASTRSLYAGEVIAVAGGLAILTYLALTTIFELDRDIPLLVLLHGLFAVLGGLFWAGLDPTPRRRFRNRQKPLK